MKSSKRKRHEEIFSSAPHGVGVIIAIACTALVVVLAAMYGDAWRIVSYSIFGAGMITLYLASTLFHCEKNVRRKYHLNTFDHSSIYVLIAATYTPFTLVAIRGPLGCVLFGIIWGLAIAGIVFKVWFLQTPMAKYFNNPSWRNGVDVHYCHWPHGAQFAHRSACVLAGGVQ